MKIVKALYDKPFVRQSKISAQADKSPVIGDVVDYLK
jgi:hypothetical protein